MNDVADPRLTRLDRQRDAKNWSFAGPVEEFAATTSAGFDPAGQVFGTTVDYALLGPPGFGRCCVPNGRTSADPHNPLLAKLTAARVRAFDRAVQECRALHADGIVGMRLRTATSFSDTTEFTFEGTAVRARSRTRPEKPFTTHVSAQDLARLLRAGWMPFALVFGTAIAACHFDGTMFRETQRSVGTAGNREVAGYTRIVNDARRQARKVLEDAVRDRGGAGTVVHETTLRFSERECPKFDQRFDYLAEATILGSAVIPFERSAPSEERAPLTIMRLDRRRRAGTVTGTETSTGSEAEPGPGPEDIPAPSLGDRAFAYWSGRKSDR